MTKIIRIETKKGIWGSYFLVLVLALGVFVTALSPYVFVPALHTVAYKPDMAYDRATWTMIILMLFWTAIVLLVGKLSDLYGKMDVAAMGHGCSPGIPRDYIHTTEARCLAIAGRT